MATRLATAASPQIEWRGDVALRARGQRRGRPVAGGHDSRPVARPSSSPADVCASRTTGGASTLNITVEPSAAQPEPGRPARRLDGLISPARGRQLDAAGGQDLTHGFVDTWRMHRRCAVHYRRGSPRRPSRPGRHEANARNAQATAERCREKVTMAPSTTASSTSVTSDFLLASLQPPAAGAGGARPRVPRRLTACAHYDDGRVTHQATPRTQFAAQARGRLIGQPDCATATSR
jgi:hypothetical protein